MLRSKTGVCSATVFVVRMSDALAKQTNLARLTLTLAHAVGNRSRTYALPWTRFRRVRPVLSWNRTATTSALALLEPTRPTSSQPPTPSSTRIRA
eukprot:3874371-Rhodomonas_salina.1